MEISNCFDNTANDNQTSTPLGANSLHELSFKFPFENLSSSTILEEFIKDDNQNVQQFVVENSIKERNVQGIDGDRMLAANMTYALDFKMEPKNIMRPSVRNGVHKRSRSWSTDFDMAKISSMLSPHSNNIEFSDNRIPYSNLYPDYENFSNVQDPIGAGQVNNELSSSFVGNSTFDTFCNESSHIQAQICTNLLGVPSMYPNFPFSPNDSGSSGDLSQSAHPINEGDLQSLDYSSAEYDMSPFSLLKTTRNQSPYPAAPLTSSPIYFPTLENYNQIGANTFNQPVDNISELQHSRKKRGSLDSRYSSCQFQRRRQSMVQLDRQYYLETGEPSSNMDGRNLDSLKNADQNQNLPSVTRHRANSLSNDCDYSVRHQILRFAEDKYTPKMVRKSGAKKEGLCDLCTPSKWLQLKNSAFWYHKQFTHGISSFTGKYFENPIEIRTSWHVALSDNSNSKDVSVYLIVEGDCHKCREWVLMYRNKKRFSTSFGSSQEIVSAILKTNTNHLDSREITLPFQMEVSRNTNGTLIVPEGINVFPSVLADIQQNETEKGGNWWWRHAHKCHH